MSIIVLNCRTELSSRPYEDLCNNTTSTSISHNMKLFVMNNLREKRVHLSDPVSDGAPHLDAYSNYNDIFAITSSLSIILMAEQFCSMEVSMASLFSARCRYYVNSSPATDQR